MRPKRVAVLGDGYVGKTALIINFIMGKFAKNYQKTHNDTYKKDLLVNGGKLSMEIIDTAGPSSLPPIEDRFYTTFKAFVIVFSVVSKCSFENALQLGSEIKQKMPEKFHLVIVGTKVDLKQHDISEKEGRRRAKKLGAEYFHLSATDPQDGAKPFQHLAHLLANEDEAQSLMLLPTDRGMGIS